MLTADNSLDKFMARCKASAGASGGGLWDRSEYLGSPSLESCSLDGCRAVRRRISSLCGRCGEFSTEDGTPLESSGEVDRGVSSPGPC